MTATTLLSYRFDRGHGIEGPVAADVIRSLQQSGNLSDATLVQEEGEAEWRPLKNHPLFAARDLPASEGPVGISGWLVLVALGLVLAPLTILATIGESMPAFESEVWEVLTTPGSPVYSVFWAPVLIFELIGNLTLLGLSVALLFLFFSRSHRFPKVYIGTTLAALALVVVDTIAGYGLLGSVDAEGAGALGRSVGACLVWVPYMLRSKRVRNTFVRS